MDPVSAALGIVGLGMQIFGGSAQAGVAKQEAAVSADEAKQEQAINQQKLQAMNLQTRRNNMQQIRQAQLAQATAVSRATSQGAQFGSGLVGGLGEISSEAGNNITANNQALQTGQAIGALNNNISNDKMQMASLGGQSATDQGISSLGGALMKIGPTIGQFSKGFSFGS